MNAKHTPGPWKARPVGELAYAERNSIAKDLPPKANPRDSKHTPGPRAFCNDTLCQANGNYLHLGKWTESAGLGKAAAANAALIAAAPELLDALRAMTHAATDARWPLTAEQMLPMNLARAAIAKATGAAS